MSVCESRWGLGILGPHVFSVQGAMGVVEQQELRYPWREEFMNRLLGRFPILEFGHLGKNLSQRVLRRWRLIRCVTLKAVSQLGQALADGSF